MCTRVCASHIDLCTAPLHSSSAVACCVCAAVMRALPAAAAEAVSLDELRRSPAVAGKELRRQLEVPQRAGGLHCVL